MLIRKVIKTFEYKNFILPKNRLLAIVPSVIHFDPNIYKDAHAFNPDRWIDQKINKFEYFPFGVGTNECVT
jgi:cytochrome P450